jgi:hypothetical protein
MTAHILTALEVAAAVTAGFLVLVAVILLAALPRVRARWKEHQPAQVALSGADSAAVYAMVVKTLAPWGFRTVGEPGGPFTLEPSGIRKWQGAKPVSVVFPPGRGETLVTGEARYVAKLTTDRKVYFLTEGAVPFWPWVRQTLTTPIVALTVILFVAIFFVLLSF